MTQQKQVYLVDGVRTPIGAFNRSLASMSAVDLGVIAAKALFARTGVSPEFIDEMMLGCILQTGQGQGVARQVAVKSGMPIETTAVTMNMLCGSGLRAVADAMRSILCGDAGMVVAGGVESMSQAPHFAHLRSATAMGAKSFEDTMIKDGLTEAFSGVHMGITAENLAAKYGLTREAQDAFAFASQEKAAKAIAAGRFVDEIAPVLLPQKKGDPIAFATDEHPKLSPLDALAKMRPAFKKDGTVTAGNASGVNDGAAVLLVASDEKVREHGLSPMARIVSYAWAGVDPQLMGIGPVPATQKALARAGWMLSDLDVIEANEAFAAQSLAVGKELGWNSDIVNVNGGAIALGHPIGASGARILVTLMHEMKKRGGKRGLATLCIGGGMGIAMCIEAV